MGFERCGQRLKQQPTFKPHAALALAVCCPNRPRCNPPVNAPFCRNRAVLSLVLQTSPQPSSWRCRDASHHAVPPGRLAAPTFSWRLTSYWRGAGGGSDGRRGADHPDFGGIVAPANARLNAVVRWCVLVVFRVLGTGESRSHAALESFGQRWPVCVWFNVPFLVMWESHTGCRPEINLGIR